MGGAGACLSGAGSSILALVAAHDNAVAQAMQAEAERCGVSGRTMMLDISPVGAHMY